MRIIVGISGASGSILAVSFLKALKEFRELETHLVVTDGAMRTLELEMGYTKAEISSMAHYFHPIKDISASIASGSFATLGMVVIPCSMKTLAGIVHGYSDNLLLRAADVCLKERRKLILVTREMPLSAIHLENMLKVTQYGALIMPPMLTFYNKPENIADMINHLTGKILMQFGLNYKCFRPWEGTENGDG